MAKSYALSKKKVREIISEAFGNAKTVKLADVLALFEGSSARPTDDILVRDADGNVVGKRCSYFGVYMPISEFGKRGNHYAYQSKLAESIVRKKRQEAIKAKDVLDEQLASGEISVDEWKSQLEAIDKAKNEKISIGELKGKEIPVYAETAEELLSKVQ